MGVRRPVVRAAATFMRAVMVTYTESKTASGKNGMADHGIQPRNQKQGLKWTPPPINNSIATMRIEQKVIAELRKRAHTMRIAEAADLPAVIEVLAEEDFEAAEDGDKVFGLDTIRR